MDHVFPTLWRPPFRLLVSRGRDRNVLALLDAWTFRIVWLTQADPSSWSEKSLEVKERRCSKGRARIRLARAVFKTPRRENSSALTALRSRSGSLSVFVTSLTSVFFEARWVFISAFYPRTEINGTPYITALKAKALRRFSVKYAKRYENIKYLLI